MQETIKTARKEKKHARCRCAFDNGNGIVHGIIVDNQGTLPWTDSFSKTPNECKAWLEERKVHGWRPECLYACGTGAKTLFGSILVKDPDGPAWHASWSLSTAEYEKELIVRKSQGFRPLTAVGHEDEAGAQRFSVIWIRYRPTP